MKVELDDEVANLEDSITHFEIEKAKQRKRFEHAILYFNKEYELVVRI